MAAYPDRDTLRLRRPDQRTPAQLAELARRELAPRPPSRELAPTLADVGLSRADRRLVSFRERYPAAFERTHAGIWWAVAHGLGQPPRSQPGRCPDGWCLARAYAKRHRLPAPRVDQVGRLLLGEPGPRCQAALGWRPPAKPKAKPRPAGRSRAPAARSSTGRQATARSSAPTRRRRPTPAELAAATRAGLTAAAFLPAHPPRPIAPDTPANRATAARMYCQTRSPSFTPAGMGWPSQSARGRR
jgi:hypothetical protein